MMIARVYRKYIGDRTAIISPFRQGDYRQEEY